VTKSDEKPKGAIPEKPTDKVTEGAEGSTAEDKVESVRPPKKHSLFLKSIPIPTSEDEIKALFDHPDKVGLVR
jgi:RNA recognition motif-containing protein